MQGRRPAPAGLAGDAAGIMPDPPREIRTSPRKGAEQSWPLHVPAWGRGRTSVPGRDPGMPGPGRPFLGEDDTLGAADGQRQRLNGPTSD